MLLKLENFIIYVSLCNSRIHVITLYSGHVCVYYASMLRCWHLVQILVRTDHPCLGVGCHTQLEELIHSIMLEHEPEHEIICGSKPTGEKRGEGGTVVERQLHRVSGCEAATSSWG
jgi:hypothetical protein